jgi:hypothetical protein
MKPYVDSARNLIVRTLILIAIFVGLIILSGLFWTGFTILLKKFGMIRVNRAILIHRGETKKFDYIFKEFESGKDVDIFTRPSNDAPNSAHREGVGLPEVEGKQQ